MKTGILKQVHTYKSILQKTVVSNWIEKKKGSLLARGLFPIFHFCL